LIVKCTGLFYKVILIKETFIDESNKDEEEHEYMLLKPTHYMLEHPMYQKNKEEETKEEEIKHDSYGEIHCFMDRKEKKGKEQKLHLQFEAEDM
jgi:hypothetical protein